MIIRIIFLLTIFGLLFYSAFGHAASKTEKTYTQEWCWPKGWEATHTIKQNGKVVAVVDCLGPDYAIEVERASNWQEAIGQSLNYARLTGAKPGIVIIMGPGEQRFLDRLNAVIASACLNIKVWTVRK